tara:strand:- start:1031 stop:2530 length:1500 start_codon:yes stop_codon:yes gene_type:complete
MAEIIVKREPIAQFLDELPGLIMQYKQLNFSIEQARLDREDRKAQAAQGILLKEYYDMKDQTKITEKMFDKYDNLSPSDVTQAGADIISIVDEQNNINMDAITQNLNTLSEYKSDLESSLSSLKGQAQTLKEMQADFAGANRVLEPHEYEAFQSHALKALEEGGLGWETTAGADVEYFKTDPTARFNAAYNMTQKMKGDEDTGAKGNYAIIQGIYTLGEGEDVDDLTERLSYNDASGKKIEPSADVVTAIQRMSMQPSYDDFITNLNAYPAEAGGDLIRSELMNNPNTSMIFNNLQQNYKAIQSLDAELGGINRSPEGDRLDQFIEQISGVTNKQALFGIYDQYTSGLDPSEHGQYFNAIELAMGGEDLGPSYLEFKGISTGGDVNTSTQQQLSSRERFDAKLTGGGVFKYGKEGEEPLLKLAAGILPVPNLGFWLEQFEDQEMLWFKKDTLRPTANIEGLPFSPADNLNAILEDLDKISKTNTDNTRLYEEYLQEIEE